LEVVEVYSINGCPSSFNAKKTRINQEKSVETLAGSAFQAYDFIRCLIWINKKQQALFTFS
jgi:hypothetical protein